MIDQATQLRNLAIQAARKNDGQGDPAPRLVVFVGGKGGVGVTTLALNTAVMLAQRAVRVVFVDASLQGADVAMLCGLEERDGTADVLAARCDLHEVLQRGPAGVLVASGVWSGDIDTQRCQTGQRRLIDQLATLGKHAELVVVDAASNPGSMMERCWQAADEIVLTTTPDPVSVMDSYTTIKTMCAHGPLPPINILVNRAADAESADDVHRRIEQSCRRFLQCPVGSLGFVPEDEHFAAAAEAAVPAVLHDAARPACCALKRVAATLTTRHQKRSVLLPRRA